MDDLFKDKAGGLVLALAYVNKTAKPGNDYDVNVEGQARTSMLPHSSRHRMASAHTCMRIHAYSSAMDSL